MGPILVSQLVYLLITTLNETLATRQVCTCPVQYLLSWQHVLRPWDNVFKPEWWIRLGKYDDSIKHFQHLSCWTCRLSLFPSCCLWSNRTFTCSSLACFHRQQMMKPYTHWRHNIRLKKIHITVPSLILLLVSLVTEIVVSICVVCLIICSLNTKRMNVSPANAAFLA